MSEATATVVITGFFTIMAIGVSGILNYRQGSAVHTIVNSRWTAMEAQLNALKAEIVELQARIDALKK